jgi:hypothetical protein
MWVIVGLKFVMLSAFSPMGIAVMFVAFLISFLSRVFLRGSWLTHFYMIVSLAVLFYLVVVVAMFGPLAGSDQSGMDLFSPMLFAMFVGVPSGVGWLFGWPVAVCLQLAASGLPDPAPEKS